ncbi:hypothetical protein [Orenia marismortui]|uniref:hypothetical protein n=1 Tax=Orenia marismortui TaxID=46469 RepID=UPI000368EE98|nr:hypothetical protein [Orenia marismortui]
MRKKLYQILLFVCILVLISFISNRFLYVKYIPVTEWNGEQYEVNPEVNSKKLKENMKIILKYYEVSFKENEKGELLIPASLQRNKEMLYNYTKKAMDEEFVKSRSE